MPAVLPAERGPAAPDIRGLVRPLRCAEVLRPGGWLALWWSHFGDPDRPDAFHDALVPLLERFAPVLLDIPSAAGVDGGAAAPPYPLDSAARMAEIDTSRCFGPVHHEVIPWTGRHSPPELRAMFASFSRWLALPEYHRTTVLDALERMAADEFGSVVERPYLTAVYLAQRR